MEKAVRELRTLIVHTSEQIAAELVDELHAMGLRADAACTASEALILLARWDYCTLLLDDQLPDGGSLAVFESLDRPDRPRPDMVMLCVPRATLEDARQGAGEPGVEYVANPQTRAEVQRLAMRIRSRLVSIGLVEDFGPEPVARPTAQPRPITERAGISLPSVEGHRKAYLGAIALVAVLITLLLIINIFLQSGSHRPSSQQAQGHALLLEGVAVLRPYHARGLALVPHQPSTTITKEEAVT